MLGPHWLSSFGALSFCAFALLFLSACNGTKLPSDYYDTWIFEGGGGGIDGRWDPAPSDDVLLELTTDNIATRYRAGKQVKRTPFSVNEGDTIFGRAWLIRFNGESEPMVIQMTGPDQLSLSMNAYDGFGQAYRRAPGPSPEISVTTRK